MSLDKRVVSVPLIDGLSDQDDNFASNPPGMVEIDEARWSRDKVIGKRFGVHVAVEPGDGSALTAASDPNQILDLDGLAHVVTQSGTFRENATTGLFSQMNAGAPKASRLVTNPVVRINQGAAKSDAAIAGDVVCVVWEQLASDNSPQGAFYGFWDVSTDTPRLLSGPTKMATVTNACRVIALASRYFIVVGLSAIQDGNICVATYDTNAGTYALSAFAALDQVAHGANHYALAPSYDATSNAWLAYLKTGGAAVKIRKLDTAGAVVATKNLASVTTAQHILHNEPISKVIVINRLGSIEYVDDALAGPSTALTFFADPASGLYTGRFWRATIGMADATGKMWVARSTAGPYLRAPTAPVGTQLAALSSTFVASGNNFVGAVVLAAHASPLIAEDKATYLAVAAQSAIDTGDSLTGGIGYLKAPVAYLCRPSIITTPARGSVVELVVAGRFGQDGIELAGNELVGSSGNFSETASHLPHLSYDQNALAAQRRLACAYPARVSSFLGGAGSTTPGTFGLSVKRGVDLMTARTHLASPLRNAPAQGLRLTGGGTGTAALDGVSFAEHTPPAIEFVRVDGFDPAIAYNIIGFNYNNWDGHHPTGFHIDETDWGVTWSYTGSDNTTPGGPGVVPGGLTYGNPNKQWGFKVVWQWYDAKGNLHRGPPSSTCFCSAAQLGYSDPTANLGSVYYVPEPVPTGATKLCFPQCYPTALLGDTNITPEAAIYACPFDGNGDFRLLGVVTPKLDPADEGRVYVVIQLVQSTSPYSVVLNNWDALYPAAPSLYTTAFAGSELVSWPSPALLSICSTQSRLWGLNAEDRLDVWYTKPIALGIAPEWSDTLRVLIPQDGGQVVGIAALDDKVVVFKRTKVFVIEGDPGDAAGNGSSLRPPRLVSSDVGCDSVESIVEGPFGVLFHSDRGFFTLDRGLSYTFVGDKVMDQLSPAAADGTTREIMSGCIIPSEAEVRYLADTSRGAGARIGLAWNYRLNRWTRRDSTAFLFSAAVKSIEWSVFTDDDGVTVARETPYAWTFSPSKLSFRTSWISLNGIAGFGRVWRAVFLFRYFNHDIKITTAQDYRSETETTRTWTQAQLLTLADSGGRLQLDVRPTVQKCEAIQFVVSEDCGNMDVNIGRGFELIGVTLEVGVKPGAYKRIAAAGRK